MLCFRTKLIRTSFHTWDNYYVLECASTGIDLIYLVLQDFKVTKWSRKKKKCVFEHEEKQGSVP